MKLLKFEKILLKHKKPLVHAHNTLHFVYWTQAAVFAHSLPSAALYGSLAVLTVVISYCAACHGGEHE